MPRPEKSRGIRWTKRGLGAGDFVHAVNQTGNLYSEKLAFGAKDCTLVTDCQRRPVRLSCVGGARELGRAWAPIMPDSGLAFFMTALAASARPP